MSNQPVKSVSVVEDRGVCEYIPFGAQDKIKLSISIVKNLVAVKTKSGKTCSDTDAIKFLALCQARRLSPFEGDCFLIGYDGKDGVPSFSLITAHQAFLKRAELNAEYDGMKSGIIVEEDGNLRDLEGDFYVEGKQVVVGGWTTVYFKNRKQPMHKRVRLKRFQKAWGIWQDDPAGMICKCAEADALRSSFPTMLGGLYLKEEMEAKAEAKVSAPIFASSTPVIEVPPVPLGFASQNPETGATAINTGKVDPSPSEVTQVLALCEKAKIKEADLVEFMEAIGIAEAGCKSVAEAHAKNDTALPMVIENWSEFSERIKGDK